MKLIGKALLLGIVSEAISFGLYLSGTYVGADAEFHSTIIGSIGRALHWPTNALVTAFHPPSDSIGWNTILIGTPILIWTVLWMCFFWVKKKMKQHRTIGSSVPATRCRVR